MQSRLLFTMNAISKPLLFLLPILAGIFGISSAGAAERTAQQLLEAGEAKIGDRVTVDVAWMDRIRLAGSRNQYVVIAAHTWDEKADWFGGMIAVVVDEGEAKRMLRIYEPKPKGAVTRFRGIDIHTKRISGVLRRGRNQKLFIDLTDGVSAPESLNVAGLLEGKIEEAVKEIKDRLEGN
ncbi:MAG: hypothetical protein ACI8UO_000552 [Verrucomicrobiales bacterium]|jgi:hypothetical protein